MSRYRDLLLSAALTAALMTGPASAGAFGLGRAALPDEIAAWDKDVRPDGTGLPAGEGVVEAGEALFSDRCAGCHGDFGEGVDNWPALMGGRGTLDQDDPVKTVGSYWPYLSTLWDYIHRSKPYGNAQSLEVDETYALVAFLLYSNDNVGADFSLSRDNFLDVVMANAGGFIIDDRAETEYPEFSKQPCMKDCKAVVEILNRASALDLTPQSEMPVRRGQVGKTASNDQTLVTAGERAFRKCKSCHQIGEGARNKTGPVLTGIVNAPAGAAGGFSYSKSMQNAASAGLIWTKEELAGFLAKPATYLKGTKMSFAGIRKKDDITALIAFLTSYSG